MVKWAYIFLFCCLPFTISAQVIRYKVSLSTEKLPLQKREELEELPELLEEYLNSYQYADDNIYNFQVNGFIQIVFESVNIGNDVYRAKLFASNGSDVKYLDESWTFKYRRGDPLYHDYPIFVNLTKMLDFSVYMILAGEMDKLEPFKGSKYYNLALDIAEQGKFESNSTGWENRRFEVTEILREDHRPFREMTAYFDQALYLHGNENGTKYLAYIEYAFSLIEGLSKKQLSQTTSKYYRRFFDDHSGNLAKLLLEKNDRYIYDKLTYIDPSHREVYLTYKRKL